MHLNPGGLVPNHEYNYKSTSREEFPQSTLDSNFEIYIVPFNYIPTLWYGGVPVWIKSDTRYRLFSPLILLLSVKIVDILTNIFIRNILLDVRPAQR